MVTAKKLMTSFLGYSSIGKRETVTEDAVIVMDGSGSIGSCEFNNGKEALKHMMDTAHKPSHDTKYAAVTFGDLGTVNFKFLPYSSAASQITTISYPNDGSTNTQAGLAEAKKLFDDRNSGIFLYLTNRFHFAVLLLSYRSQRTSKCGKNKKSGPRAARRVGH